MKVLLDADVLAPLLYRLHGHLATTAQRMGWGELKNGELLAAAEAEGFDVFLTGDKNLAYQQNLRGRKLAIIVLATTQWKQLRENTIRITEAIDGATPGSFQQLM